MSQKSILMKADAMRKEADIQSYFDRQMKAYLAGKGTYMSNINYPSHSLDALSGTVPYHGISSGRYTAADAAQAGAHATTVIIPVKQPNKASAEWRDRIQKLTSEMDFGKFMKEYMKLDNCGGILSFGIGRERWAPDSTTPLYESDDEKDTRDKIHVAWVRTAKTSSGLSYKGEPLTNEFKAEVVIDIYRIVYSSRVADYAQRRLEGAEGAGVILKTNDRPMDDVFTDICDGVRRMHTQMMHEQQAWERDIQQMHMKAKQWTYDKSHEMNREWMNESQKIKQSQMWNNLIGKK